MSNAVKSLSAPLAQCVKHRSSNQTLNPLFIFFFFFFFFCYHNKFLFFLHSFFILPFLWSLFSSMLKKLFSTGDNW